MIELVVFDMAGTTVDEDNVVYKTVREAVNAAGYSFTQTQVQAAGAGKEKSQAIRDVLSLDGESHDSHEIDLIFSNFKKLLAVAYQRLRVTEQPGATAVFSALRQQGVKVALNTGYDRPTAECLIKKLGWMEGSDYDVLITASDVEHGRPAPDMIFLAMKKTNVTDASRVAKVGDSEVDIEEGKNSGCGVTVGITTGAQTREQLAHANPTAIIDSLEELLDMLKMNEPSGNTPST
ncbi:MAG: phosphonatase-like hydrolase [Planctomycetota bacterium]|nr:phosphonatase-like hydrolase [Planctomycetota bacterium]